MPRADRSVPLAIALLLLAALAVRQPQIDRPPFDVAPTRQHHSALRARAIHFEMFPDGVPAWRRQVVDDYLAYATIPEPGVIETSAALAYRVAGREQLWIPRALSVVYWVIGGFFLFLAARRVSTPDGALIAAAVYLFLPWAVTASRSFQPDPLSIMWMCISLWTLLRYEEQPTRVRLLVAALTALPAILIRLMTGFFLYAVLGVMLLRRHGVRRAVVHAHGWIYVAISVLPAAIYYGHGLLVDELVRIGASKRFIPHLFVDASFWQGWWRMISVTITPGPFIAALVLLPLALRGTSRTLTTGMWLGYLAYGAVFNFHIYTHPYYQTLAVPMIALSFAPLARMFPGPVAAPWRLGALALLVVGLLALGRPSSIATTADDREKVNAYRAVGELTNHSVRVVYLTDFWGTALRYHGEVSGRYWPTRFEIEMYRPMGADQIPEIPPRERLERLGAEIGGAEYFVVTDMAEFSRQADLISYLDSEFSVVSRAARHVVYDLRKRPPSAHPGG